MHRFARPALVIRHLDSGTCAAAAAPLSVCTVPPAFGAPLTQSSLCTFVSHCVNTSSPELSPPPVPRCTVAVIC